MRQRVDRRRRSRRAAPATTARAAPRPAHRSTDEPVSPSTATALVLAVGLGVALAAGTVPAKVIAPESWPLTVKGEIARAGADKLAEEAKKKGELLLDE